MLAEPRGEGAGGSGSWDRTVGLGGDRNSFRGRGGIRVKEQTGLRWAPKGSRYSRGLYFEKNEFWFIDVLGTGPHGSSGAGRGVKT